MHAPNVAAVDLRFRIETGLLVVAIGVEEVLSVLVGVGQLLLRDRRDRRRRRHCGRRIFDFLRLCYPPRYECSDANRTEQQCTIDVFRHLRSLHALAYCLEMMGLSPSVLGISSPSRQSMNSPLNQSMSV